MSVLSACQPQAVFSYFEKLCSVPHGSGNTKQISDLCVGFAKELGLRYHQDELNNLIIWKDGTPGYENAPTVILQGHMDMVCTKTDDCTKDMAVEGLDLATDGQWVWAEKTTLGGDNCIAVAMILAVLADPDLPHPPLEAVFTVDEETGMDGAMALDCSLLQGKLLLNLDSEEEGVFTVSCAGGVRAECRLPAMQAPLQGEVCYQVTISGLQGGHSGMDINHGRANANQLMGRVLQQASEKLDGLRLADLQGGVFDNVICPLCDAKMAVPADEAKKFEAFLQEFEQVLKNEYAGCDDGLQLTFAPCQLDSALSAADTERISKVMAALPFGVQAMSVDFPGLVQTSINQGIVSMKEDGLRLSLMIRSSINSQREMVLQQVSAIIRLGGGTVEPQSAYPAWQYVRHSPMRERLMDAYRSINGKDGKLFATHGGLECGLFLEKIPGLDAVSFGPELHDVHSARERLSVPSTERVYQLLCEFLKRSK